MHRVGMLVRASSAPSRTLPLPRRRPLKTPFTLPSFAKPPLPPPMASSWSCARCTFINPPSHSLTPSCSVCHAPSSAAAAAAPLRTWSCPSCTFANPLPAPSCEVCGARAYSSFDHLALDADDLSALGSVFRPLQRCGGSSIPIAAGAGDDVAEVMEDPALFRPLRRRGAASVRGGAEDDATKEEVGSYADAVTDDDVFELVDASENKKARKGGSYGVTVTDDDVFELVDAPEDKKARKEGSCGVTVTDDDAFELVDASEDKKARKEGSCGLTGSGFQPMQRCSNKRGLTDAVANSPREKMPRKEQVPSTAAGIVERTLERGVVKVLSYNVWFREDLEVYKRMKALGDLIQEHTPDIICFQEVTPNIYEIFQKSDWWKGYTCSVAPGAFGGSYFCMQMSKLPVRKFSSKPFSNSIMGRELSLAEVDVGTGKVLVVATSHLESPCPGPPKWDQMYSKERVAQAKESISLLGASPNVIFGGDMNWDDKLDGAFPVPEGWIDAWTKLKPREDGWTYDTKSNQMISGNRKLQKRLDRFVCKLKDFEVRSIQMIGMEAIPGLSHCKEKKVKNVIQKLMLPVLPSDHYGLLLTISSK